MFWPSFFQTCRHRHRGPLAGRRVRLNFLLSSWTRWTAAGLLQRSGLVYGFVGSPANRATQPARLRRTRAVQQFPRRPGRFRRCSADTALFVETFRPSSSHHPAQSSRSSPIINTCDSETLPVHFEGCQCFPMPARPWAVPMGLLSGDRSLSFQFCSDFTTDQVQHAGVYIKIVRKFDRSFVRFGRLIIFGEDASFVVSVHPMRFGLIGVERRSLERRRLE